MDWPVVTYPSPFGGLPRTGDPLYWLMQGADHEALSAFISESFCTKCEAQPGDPCVTVSGNTPGRETPSHKERNSAGRISWQAHKAACMSDPEMKALEKQVRDLSLQLARARRIKTLKTVMAHLKLQAAGLSQEGWAEARELKALRRTLEQVREVLEKLSPAEKAAS